MNKSCEKTTTAVKIFYMWMFCITLKERNTKWFVQNWHSPSHLRPLTSIIMNLKSITKRKHNCDIELFSLFFQFFT
jgi:hypothetical protein